MTNSCVSCGGSLRGSPSDDFCSYDCQQRWHADRVAPEVPARTVPSPRVPVLGWYGAPTPDVLAAGVPSDPETEG